MRERELVDKKNVKDLLNSRFSYPEAMIKELNTFPVINEKELAKALFTEFREKLSKWMYLNSESVCGDSMIGVEYLEGHINELLYEMGIYGDKEYEEE